MSTKLTQNKKWHMMPVGGLFCLCLSVMVFPAQANDVSFTATFESPTCEVVAPAMIDFGDIDSQDIKRGGSIADPQSVSITLSGCSGWLKAAQKPGIRVSGTGNTNSGDFLFMLPATSVAVNYGVQLTTASNSTVISDGTFIPTAGTAGQLPSDGTVIALNAALSCGTKCSDSATRGGRLNAAITFSFAYE